MTDEMIGFAAARLMELEVTVERPVLATSAWRESRARSARILVSYPATSGVRRSRRVARRAAMSRPLISRSIAKIASMIMVAHRLQIVAQADYIAVMDAGRVVDSGTPADLEARCALYRSL